MNSLGFGNVALEEAKGGREDNEFGFFLQKRLVIVKIKLFFFESLGFFGF